VHEGEIFDKSTGRGRISKISFFATKTLRAKASQRVLLKMRAIKVKMFLNLRFFHPL
jgi:hypothetical protein